MKPKPHVELPVSIQPTTTVGAPGQPFNVDKFIAEAVATKADRLPRPKSTSRLITGQGRMPAAGFRRTSLDLPEELYKQLKIAALDERRSLREILVEGAIAWLKKRQVTK